MSGVQKTIFNVVAIFSYWNVEREEENIENT